MGNDSDSRRSSATLTPPFEPLSRIFRGDVERVCRALEIFARVTCQDLEQLDAAYASRDWATVRMLAHKMKAGCLQIGEATAAAGLVSIERALLSDQASETVASEFASTRDELDNVMRRVATYLASRDKAGDE